MERGREGRVRVPVRQSVWRRTMVAGVPVGVYVFEACALICVNFIGGLSLGKVIFSVLVAGVLHPVWIGFYGKDSFFFDNLIASSRYRLIYSGGSPPGEWRE